MLRSLLYYLLFLLILIDGINAQEKIATRPKIGLVLSGGGAKGLAHIGVLKVLEKRHIPIDYITGTSMGSIIGALYSIGYSADEIEKIAMSMNWKEIFDGSSARNLIAIEEKDQEGKYILEVPMKKGKPVIPTGLILGQKLEMELTNLTWSVHGIDDFSKFPVPFACIATNIETGEAVVIKKGYLPDAIRASMAIPSVFSAVEIDGKLLVDGGIVRNFPVSDARMMGANIIIGVDVASPLYKKEQLTSMLKIMEQTASFLNEQTNINETKLVDILIKPNISGFDASSFDAADSLIKIGEIAAILLEDQINSLKNKLLLYNDSIKLHQSPKELYSIYINKVEIEGLKKVSKSLIKSKLNIKDSSWVTLNEIDKAISRVYGSRYFEKVNYRIIQKNNENILIIRVIEQPFSIYKVGIHYNNYFNASIGLNGTFRNLLGEGSRLMVNAKVGSSPEFNIDYSIFTSLKPSIGLIMRAEYYKIKETIYNLADTINFSINKNAFIGRLGFASSLNNSTLLLFGSDFTYNEYIPLNSIQSEKTLYKKGILLFTELKHDSYNRNIYPNSGLSFNCFAGFSFNNMPDNSEPYDLNFWKFRLTYDQYFPLGDKFNYRHSFTGAMSLSKNPFYDDNYFIGGELNFKNYIFPLSGYKFMQIMGTNIITGAVELRYEPWSGKFIIGNINAGIAEDQAQNIINPERYYFGSSIGLGFKTFLGPIEYKICFNNFDNKINHWIKIGYYF